jgi:hypothetical protein
MGFVLLICGNDSLSDIICLNLRVFLGLQVIVRPDAQSGMEVLKLLPEVKIIVSQGQIGSEETAQYIDQYFDQHNLDHFFIVLGSAQSFRRAQQVIPDIYSWREGIRSIIKHIGLTGVKFDDSIIPDYIAIQPKLLAHAREYPSDFFIRIERKDDRPKYVMRMKKGEEVDQSELSELGTKGVRELYIVKSERFHLCKTLVEILTDRLKDDLLELDKRIELTNALQNNLQLMVSTVGFNKQTIHSCDVAIKSMEKVAHVAFDLKTYYEKILNNPNFKLVYGISQLTSYFAAGIVEVLGWTSKEVQISKLVAASFFNDMTLSNENWSLIRSEDHPLMKGLDHHERDQVNEHAYRASLIVDQHPKMTSGVADIIREHHGQKTGKGFASAIDQKISPLAIIFIICEATAIEMFQHQLEHASAPDSQKVFFNVKTQYSRNHTRQYLSALEKILLGNHQVKSA